MDLIVHWRLQGKKISKFDYRTIDIFLSEEQKERGKCGGIVG